jgi:hypothetical protein
MSNYPIFSYVSHQTNTDKLGGPFRGYSPQQTINNYKDSESVMTRRVLRQSWNTPQARKNMNGYYRVTTPFRAVNNLGDYLSRNNYACGGSNQVNASRPGWKSIIGNINSVCDGTGIAGSYANNRFVSDSSDYTTYRKQNAINHTYNDLTNGGDQSNASYTNLLAVRRGF